jgi:hypothetical protein
LPALFLHVIAKHPSLTSSLRGCRSGRGNLSPYAQIGSPRLSAPQGPWTGPRHKAFIQSRTDIEPGVYHAADGCYGSHLELDSLGVLAKQRKKLNSHDGNFLVKALDCAGLDKLKHLVFVKDPAV